MVISKFYIQFLCLTCSAKAAIERKTRACRWLESRKTRARRLKYKRVINHVTASIRAIQRNYEKKIADDQRLFLSIFGHGLGMVVFLRKAFCV